MNGIRFPLRKVSLPKRRSLEPYLDRIDSSGIYSNYGPLAVEFEKRLSDHFGCEAGNVVVLANATVALTLVLGHLEVKRGSKCLVPSLTFLASPAAAIAAGMEPFFMDIDPDRWACSPVQAAAALEAAGGPAAVGAVMPVSTYGNPLDLAEWRDFQRRTGVPVVIDAAWCFDSVRSGSLPQCVSLHATKVFGSGEGGLILSSDSEMIASIRRRANFGILPDKQVLVPGINGKMSEYSAAVGLAGLDGWRERRAQTLELQRCYADALSDVRGLSIMPGFGDVWAGGTIAVKVNSFAARVAAALLESGVEARHWWGRPCHRQPAYEGFGHADLSQTEWLIDRIINLPFWTGMSQEDVAYVSSAVGAALRA